MLHTPRFDLDEDVLPLGVELYLRLVKNILNSYQQNK